MQQKEKSLIGIVMIIGGIGLVAGVGLPQWDAYSAHTTEIATLNADIKTNTDNRDNLKTQITLLENKTDVPEGIVIESFTETTREAVIKKILDQIVGISSDTKNKFISLLPKEVDPIVSTAKPPEGSVPTPGGVNNIASSGVSTNTTTGSTTMNTDGSTDGKASAPPPPLLSTFGYEISIRGTYDTIQQFLKAIAAQKTMMEINSITLANESDNDVNSGSNSGTGISNPAYPIRLTAKFRLALQQVGT